MANCTILRDFCCLGFWKYRTSLCCFWRLWIGSDAGNYQEKMEEPEAGWLKGRKEESKEGWAREGEYSGRRD